jgi:hypothetical protein
MLIVLAGFLFQSIVAGQVPEDLFRVEYVFDQLEGGPLNAIVGDIDDESGNELVIGTGKNGTFFGFTAIYKFDGTEYKEVFRTPVYEYSDFGFTIGDVDNDGRNELVIGTGDPDHRGEILIYKFIDGAYELLWKGGRYRGRRENLCIGDADNDGLNELAVGVDFYDRELYVWKWNGYDMRVQWHIEGNDIVSVDIADSDNDGQNELIVGGAAWEWYDWSVYEWDGSSYSLVWNSQRMGYMVAKVGDIDQDGLNEVLVTDSGYGHGDNGTMVYRWNGQDGYHLLWARTRLDMPVSRLGYIGNPLNQEYPQFSVFNANESDLVGASDVELYQWNGSTIQMVWSYRIYAGWMGPVFGDCDNDGIEEMIVYDLNQTDPKFIVFGLQQDADDLDSDNDGMPDGWETKNGLDPGDPTGENGPDGDPDQDGIRNLDEYELGSDPRLINAFLKVHSVNVTWNGLAGVMYQIQATDDLDNPTWEPVGDPIPGVDGLNQSSQFTVQAGQQFFKVIVLKD